MATEKEKMLAGDFYKPGDAELKALRQVRREKMELFNSEIDGGKRSEILKSWLGATGKHIYMERTFSCDYGSNIYVGENFYANFNQTFLDVCEIRIGDNVMIGPNCQLLTPLHPLDPVERNSGLEYGAPITIGNNVWLAGGVTVLPGVTLGDNVVVGAGSVVTKSFGDNVVLAGNPAKIIKTVQQEQTYLTIDIGGTFIKYALITGGSKLSQEDKQPTPTDRAAFLSVLEELISSFRQQIAGVAIACPGEINTKTGFVFHGGLIPYLKAFPLGSYLSERFDLPVSVVNDADAAGLAEARYGVLSNLSCGAVLVLGTGVGSAVVSEGNLLSLQSNQEKANKFRVGLFDFSNSDGQVWQQIRQTFSLYRKGLEQLLVNTGSAVQFVNKASQLLGLHEADGQAVFQALENEPPKALQELFNQYCQDIAYLILNLQTFFQLEKVAIGGGISSQPLLIKEINRQYQQLLENEHASNDFVQVPIMASKFYNNANLIGAFCQFQAQVLENKDKESRPAIFKKRQKT